MKPSMNTSRLNKEAALRSHESVHLTNSVGLHAHHYAHAPGSWNANNGTAAATSSGQKMQAAKRLDWRFLLPNPELNHVAYWGPQKNRLAEALALFSQKLTLLQEPNTDKTLPDSQFVGEEFTTSKTTYDLVVLCNPTRKLLQWVPTILSSTGSVYLEAQNLFWPQRWFQRNFIHQASERPLLVRPKDYSTILQQGGLTQTQAFWMWPTFDNTRKIIPLDAPNVLSYVSTPQRHERRNIKRFLKPSYRQWFLESGWLSLFVPCFGIIASTSPK